MPDLMHYSAKVTVCFNRSFPFFILRRSAKGLLVKPYKLGPSLMEEGPRPISWPCSSFHSACQNGQKKNVADECHASIDGKRQASANPHWLPNQCHKHRQRSHENIGLWKRPRIQQKVPMQASTRCVSSGRKRDNHSLKQLRRCRCLPLHLRRQLFVHVCHLGMGLVPLEA